MVSVPNFIGRLGSRVLNQLDVLGWYKDISILFLFFNYIMYAITLHLGVPLSSF